MAMRRNSSLLVYGSGRYTLSCADSVNHPALSLAGNRFVQKPWSFKTIEATATTDEVSSKVLVFHVFGSTRLLHYNAPPAAMYLDFSHIWSRLMQMKLVHRSKVP
mmetsp:Transcript_90015/g.259531  ORF Transcript_90015/g.259531 Transcript_90015/m.259531 type:complete len:105 (+) Transcript_90015:23-337(+)